MFTAAPAQMGAVKAASKINEVCTRGRNHESYCGVQFKDSLSMSFVCFLFLRYELPSALKMHFITDNTSAFIQP